jgi:stage II sporulation protein AA (anti-sigma F factor antagonist)
MQNENEIKLEKQGGVTILDIRGDVTAFSEPFLNEAYRTASSQGADRILLKMDQQAYINSGGIAVLIQILAQTRKKKQRIGITGISEHFKKIFNMVGITKFAKIFNSVEVALEALTAEPG